MLAALKLMGIATLWFLLILNLQAQYPDPDMVFVQGGKFSMGSKLGGKDEQPVHEVILQDFYIGKYEVTQFEYKTIMGHDTNKCYFEGCDRCPVERVSWFNVQDYITRLNEKTKSDYRLPTEAEWEYAARGGALSKNYKYSGSNTDSVAGWIVGRSQATTHPAGLKQPNELGIFDMTGNVFEWCSDWYSAGWYQVSPKDDPTGPAEGTFRVIRGGSWFYDYSSIRVTDRRSSNPSYRYGYVGFRLCRSAANRKPSQSPPAKTESGKTNPRDARNNSTYKKFIGF
ncbi:MAG: SUMF1/EgtB/PvdO family nonheme iron enzyme [Bacteroidota bacterium]